MSIFRRSCCWGSWWDGSSVRGRRLTPTRQSCAVARSARPESAKRRADSGSGPVRWLLDRLDDDGHINSGRQYRVVGDHANDRRARPRKRGGLQVRSRDAVIGGDYRDCQRFADRHGSGSVASYPDARRLIVHIGVIDACSTVGPDNGFVYFSDRPEGPSGGPLWVTFHIALTSEISPLEKDLSALDPCTADVSSDEPRRHLSGDDTLAHGPGPGAHFLIGQQRHRGDRPGPITALTGTRQDRRDVLRICDRVLRRRPVWPSSVTASNPRLQRKTPVGGIPEEFIGSVPSQEATGLASQAKPKRQALG